MPVDEFFRRKQQGRGNRAKKYEGEPDVDAISHVTLPGKHYGDLGTLPLPSPQPAGEPPRVRYIAPGVTGRDLMASAEKPAPAVGQIWYSPEGHGHKVESIKAGVANMSRAVSERQFIHGKVTLATLSERWIYGGEASNG